MRRFLAAFLRRFWGAVVEKVMEVLLVLGALAYPLIHFGPSRAVWQEHFWEACIPLAWALSVIIIYQSIRSAHDLISTIRREANQPPRESLLQRPSGGPFTISAASPLPKYFRLKVWAASSSLIVAAVLLSLSVWHASRGEHPSQIPPSVSPEYIAVNSTVWEGTSDVTVTNHIEEPWYDCDLLIAPTTQAIQYSVLPLGGLGSDIVPVMLGYSDGSAQWPISKLAPKGSVVYRFTYKLKTPSAGSELKLSLMPGSRTFKGPRVMMSH
jgi:hypothetical protein